MEYIHLGDNISFKQLRSKFISSLCNILRNHVRIEIQLSTLNNISEQILSPIIILEDLNETKINRLLAKHDIDTFAYRHCNKNFLKYKDLTVMKTRHVKCIK